MARIGQLCSYLGNAITRLVLNYKYRRRLCYVCARLQRSIVSYIRDCRNENRITRSHRREKRFAVDATLSHGSSRYCTCSIAIATSSLDSRRSGRFRLRPIGLSEFERMCHLFQGIMELCDVAPIDLGAPRLIPNESSRSDCSIDCVGFIPKCPAA